MSEMGELISVQSVNVDVEMALWMHDRQKNVMMVTQSTMMLVLINVQHEKVVHDHDTMI